jgi:hypothetical protein
VRPAVGCSGIVERIAVRHAAAERSIDLEDKTHGRYVYLHPVVGRLDLGFETLRLPDDPDQALIMHTTEPNSPSATALRLLATWAATSTHSTAG